MNVKKSVIAGLGSLGARHWPGWGNLLPILVLAAALRLAYVGLLAAFGPGHTGFLEGDSGTYLAPAKALWLEGRFLADGRPEIFRTPGYPLLLAPGFGLGHPLAAAILSQVLISTATVWLVHRLASQLYGSQRISDLAALFFAIEPLSIFFTGRILSETLFTALLAIHILFIVRAIMRPSAKPAALAGLALAFATLTRPVSILLPVVELPLLLWYCRGRALGLQAAVAVWFLICALGPVGAWTMRNHLVAGYTGFSAISVVDLYFYRAGDVTARAQHRPYDEVFRELNEAERGRPMDLERLRAMRLEASRIIAARPDLLLAQVVTGVFQNMSYGASRLEMAWNARSSRVVPELGIIALLMLEYVGVGVAMAMLRRGHGPREAWACLLVAAYLLVISAGPQADARFRTPVMPLLLPLAAAGLCALRRSDAKSEAVRRL